MTTIYIPKKINVGFQDRKGTYTGRLAYIIYWDEKGTLRKETSWKQWRDKSIDPENFDNVPTDGFVLNKKAGGYSTGWNHRQTYCRVYDPRNFEFEITIPNLLYILENTSSIKGKGLEGKFVYGWDGANLLLIPEASPDYKEIMEYSRKINNPKKFGVKNMIAGATYVDNKNRRLVYLGRFDKYCDNDWTNAKYGGKLQGRYYFFWLQYHEPNYRGEVGEFVTMSSLTRKIVDIVDESTVNNYAYLMDSLERTEMFSPLDWDRDIFTYMTVVDLANYIKEYGGYGNHIYVKPVDGEPPKSATITRNHYYRDSDISSVRVGVYYGNGCKYGDLLKKLKFNQWISLEEVVKTFKPIQIKEENQQYLKNGKVKKG